MKHSRLSILLILLLLQPPISSASSENGHNRGWVRAEIGSDSENKYYAILENDLMRCKYGWRHHKEPQGGQSYIRERIFDKRFSQVAELRKLGAAIALDEEDGLAIVSGPTDFTGADTRPDNIRAASCILLAGLACPETTIVRNIYQIGRGHFDIENRFQAIGARVVKKKE